MPTIELLNELLHELPTSRELIIPFEAWEGERYVSSLFWVHPSSGLKGVYFDEAPELAGIARFVPYPDPASALEKLGAEPSIALSRLRAEKVEFQVNFVGWVGGSDAAIRSISIHNDAGFLRLTLSPPNRYPYELRLAWGNGDTHPN